MVKYEKRTSVDLCVKVRTLFIVHASHTTWQKLGVEMKSTKCTVLILMQLSITLCLKKIKPLRQMLNETGYND